jgi:hypothetical protein
MDSEIDHFEGLCSSLYGTCALKFSTNICNSDGKEFDKDVALDCAYRAVRKVNSGDYSGAYHLGYVTLFSFRSPGSYTFTKYIASSGSLSNLYSLSKSI